MTPDQTEQVRVISESLSRNPVQRAWIAQILEIWQMETDDIYDIANLVAALRKASDYIMEGSNQFYSNNRENLNEYINQAHKDWPKNQ